MALVAKNGSGKSTLFNALTASNNAQAANYPFCTIEPNTGVVTVPVIAPLLVLYDNPAGSVPV